MMRGNTSLRPKKYNQALFSRDKSSDHPSSLSAIFLFFPSDPLSTSSFLTIDMSLTEGEGHVTALTTTRNPP